MTRMIDPAADRQDGDDAHTTEIVPLWCAEHMEPHCPRHAPKRGHLLTITKTDLWTADEPDWEWQITCLAPNLCGGWQDCDGTRARRRGAATPRHRWDHRQGRRRVGGRAGHGPLDERGSLRCGASTACVVSAQDDVSDYVWDIAAEHGPGVHEVADDWDDDSLCALDHLRTRDIPPVVHAERPGGAG